MFEKIKRLSAEYRKHEKEIEQLKVEQIIQSGINAINLIQATYQTIVDSTVKTLELYKQYIIDKDQNSIETFGGVGESWGSSSAKVTITKKGLVREDIK